MHFKTLMQQKKSDARFIKNILLLGAGIGMIIAIDYTYNKINHIYQSYKKTQIQILQTKLNHQKKLYDDKTQELQKLLNDQKKLNNE